MVGNGINGATCGAGLKMEGAGGAWGGLGYCAPVTPVTDPLQPGQDDRRGGETIFSVRGEREVTLRFIRSSQDCHNYLI